MSIKREFIQGNTAITKGALYAGANFYAGYPITPSSEIAEISSRELMLNGGIFIQMEDEIASMAAVVGGVLAGKKAFTATSGPGFSLMQENLGYAQLAEIPCVIINVQRSGPSTGLATKPAQADVMQARWGRHGDQSIIALSPSNIQECFDLTVRAFNLAEKYRTPVILLADEIVAHLRESLTIDEESIKVIEREKPQCKPEEYLPFKVENGKTAPLAEYGGPYKLRISGSMHAPNGLFSGNPDNCQKKTSHINDKINNNTDDIVQVKTYYTDEEYDMLVIAFGSTTRAARAAILDANKTGCKIGLLQLITIWPFADKEIREYASRAKKVLIPEMNLGQVASEVKRILGPDYPIYTYNKTNGTGITPKEILSKIKEVY